MQLTAPSDLFRQWKFFNEIQEEVTPEHVQGQMLRKFGFTKPEF